MQDLESGFAKIQNFNSLSPSDLEDLGQALGLRMSRAELIYCAKHYQGRRDNSISAEELRFIDALACPSYTSPAKIAVSEMLTNEPYVAETFHDVITKLQALGKPSERPITLGDLASLPQRYLTALSNIKIPELIGTHDNARTYLEAGCISGMRLSCEQGCFDLLKKLPLSLQSEANYADALVLLLPAADTQSAVFDTALAQLICDPALRAQIHCASDTSRTSIAHTVLSLCSGAVLGVRRLPEQMQSLGALTENFPGLLLALPQDAVNAFHEKAEQTGVSLYYFGVVDHAGYLIIKDAKDAIIETSISYLKSICFIRSYSLRIESEACDHGAACTVPARITPCDDAQTDACVAYTQMPLRTRNAVYTSIEQDPYHHALYGAADALCTAIATGAAPNQVYLHARMGADLHTADRATMSHVLAALLGLYRFSMEMVVPVHTDVHPTMPEPDLLVLASAPTERSIPAALQGRGKIYLLRPLYDSFGFPVWEDFRKMIAYLHCAVQDGKIKSARAIGALSPAEVLTAMSEGACGIVPNPDFMQEMTAHYPCALLVETDCELQGDLVAVSTIPHRPVHEQDVQKSDKIL